jgi:hypothetical protein
MENVKQIIEKIRDEQIKHRDSLTGIERMQYNFMIKHHNWMLHEDDERCVTIGEVVDRVKKYAPKAISGNREEFVKAVENIWSVTHDCTIASTDWLQEDLKWELENIFN